jgi:hypothetical protein
MAEQAGSYIAAARPLIERCRRNIAATQAQIEDAAEVLRRSWRLLPDEAWRGPAAPAVGKRFARFRAVRKAERAAQRAARALGQRRSRASP